MRLVLYCAIICLFVLLIFFNCRFFQSPPNSPRLLFCYARMGCYRERMGRLAHVTWHRLSDSAMTSFYSEPLTRVRVHFYSYSGSEPGIRRLKQGRASQPSSKAVLAADRVRKPTVPPYSTRMCSTPHRCTHRWNTLFPLCLWLGDAPICS
jgi:hypothetical protein